MRVRFLTSTAVGVALAGSVLAPRPAEACGGFFCSQVPIEQSGEQIAFFVAPEGNEISAHVRIFYQGAAEDFAWVVPVATVPTLGVGTDALFQTLDQVTRPVFYLEWQAYGMCTQWGGWQDEGPVPAPTAGGDADNAGVQVIDQKQVGPYDTVILRSDDTDELHTWLVDNGYDVTEAGIAAMQPYIEKGDVFVALKLQQDKAVGDIQPLVMTFEEASPCIPLRLTAIAALDDMDVTAFVFADQRTVPDNYYHVELNEAKVNWMDGGSNYRSVVKQAADEGFGNAFTTEFAGASAFLKEMFFRSGQWNLAALRATTDPAQFVGQLLSQGFPRTTQMQNLLREHIPMPQSLKDQGVSEQSFYNCLDCYPGQLGPFDPNAFVDDLEAQIVEPLKVVQAQVDRAKYLTRLYTLISPEEMNKDPLFFYNGDLGDVSNIHTAKAYPLCEEAIAWPWPVKVELDDGRTVVFYPDSNGSYPSSQLDGMPAALKVEQMATSGPGVVVVDNSGPINDFLEKHNRQSGCGCRVGAADPGRGAGWAMLALAGILAAGVRRRFA